MAILTIVSPEGKSKREVTPGRLLSDALRDGRAAPAMPCGGNHTCGKCKIRAQGALSPVTQAEMALLTQEELAEGVRLACFVQIEGDCTAYTAKQDIETLSWARMPVFTPDGEGYGLAVDIGTTTVAVRLYDRVSGTPLAEVLEGNRQAVFGADVITRIGATGEGKAQEMTDTIRGQLADMAAKCMKQAGVTELTAAVVTGNTTMLHFYEGLDARGIAVSPFTPTSLFGFDSAYPLAGAPTLLPHCIGSYVGADIVCALLASEMPRHPDKLTLLADIGTNGEIALMKDGKLLCCSTAAGPAFEGAGLHQGMRAAPGAITSVKCADGQNVSVQVLGGGEAIGLCGSGILDAVRVMLNLGILDDSGLIDEEYEGQGEITEWDGQPAWKLPGTQVLVTQKDIRQIQLAKSAICAGIQTLLSHEGVEAQDIEAFYIAGGFGHSMDAESAAQIGLFPPALLSKVTVLGNGALAGAAMLLLRAEYRAEAQAVVALSEELALSTSEEFMDYYVEGMLFGEEEA